jgi:squalene synthase HpnC
MALRLRVSPLAPPALAPLSEMSEDLPPAVPSLDEVMGRATSENFPVALRLLPRSTRSHLLAIYGFARLVDQLGDAADGDRLALLDWLEAELDRAFEGKARHQVMARLSATLAELDLDRVPFCDLIEANRRDQLVSRYATFDDLVDYCRYSANPVGRLVLAVFGVSSPERVILSDRICTALQVLEHAQDVAEDAVHGRIYLPLQDLDRFGCTEDELTASRASRALRSVVALQVARARTLLESSGPLLACLHGMARLAVAGFAAGGLATADSIERAEFEVLGQKCRPTRAGMAGHALGLVVKAADLGRDNVGTRRQLDPALRAVRPGHDSGASRGDGHGFD